jgi:hypothetical protein
MKKLSASCLPTTVSAFKIAPVRLFDAVFPTMITMLFFIVFALGLHREIENEPVYD